VHPPADSETDTLTAFAEPPLALEAQSDHRSDGSRVAKGDGLMEPLTWEWRRV
jgi:hypothetical protein